MQAFDSLCLFSCHRNGVWYLQGASHLWTPFSSPAACAFICGLHILISIYLVLIQCHLATFPRHLGTFHGHLGHLNHASPDLLITKCDI